MAYEQEVVTFLEKLRKLLKTAWIKKAMAMDIHGIDVNPRAKCAKKFCLLGAIIHIPADKNVRRRVKTILGQIVPYENKYHYNKPSANHKIISFNDNDHVRLMDVIHVINESLKIARKNAKAARFVDYQQKVVASADGGGRVGRYR